MVILKFKKSNMKNIIKLSILGCMLVLVAGSCKKLARPALGNYPHDVDPHFPLYPGGPLKFFTAFDGTTDPLMNAVDSIRANFPASNPLTAITGIKGKAVQGVDQKALLYPSANDFNKVTSFTIAFWEKNGVPTGGSPQFVFSLASSDYWHQSALFMLVDHDGAGSTADSAAVSLAIQDNWFVTHNAEKLPGHMLNGSWHHIAITYDETNSRISYFVDGVKATNVSAASSTWKDGGTPHGPIHFTNTSSFVLGGWNKHGNLGNGAPTDAWIQSWQGGLDQFRLYGKVLTDSEILALYNSKL
jgi:hypothetical protein